METSNGWTMFTLRFRSFIFLQQQSFSSSNRFIDSPFRLHDLSNEAWILVYMKYPVRGPSPIAVHGPIAVHSAIFSHLFWTVYFTTQWSTITGPSPIAVHAPITVHGSWNEKTSDVFIWIFSFLFFFFFGERKEVRWRRERKRKR